MMQQYTTDYAYAATQNKPCLFCLLLRRLLQQNTTAGTVGNACTIGPACGDLSVTCKLDPKAAITEAGGSLAGLTVVPGGVGCLQSPYAGRTVSISADSLAMNQYYQLLVVTEDTLYPNPNRQGCLHHHKSDVFVVCTSIVTQSL